MRRAGREALSAAVALALSVGLAVLMLWAHVPY